MENQMENQKKEPIYWENELKEYGYGKIIWHTFIAIFCLIVFFKSFKIIDAGEKGLLFNFGAIQEIEYQDGLHFKMPFYQVIKTVSIQPQKISYTVQVGEDGAITKDNQTIGAELNVFYKYQENKLVDMYKNYSEKQIADIILSLTKETFKTEIGSYDVFKLPMTQEEIQKQVLEKLKVKISVYPINILELKIVNYNWSDDFDKQIKMTMERAQQVKQKEQELLIAEQEAQKQVKEATAQKESIIIEAEGAKEAAKLNAEAKALEGEGIKKYNESVAVNWNIELKKMELEIERKRMEQWNGAYVPNNVYSPIPLSQGGIQGQ